jgi:hypothetical protein
MPRVTVGKRSITIVWDAADVQLAAANRRVFQSKRWCAAWLVAHHEQLMNSLVNHGWELLKTTITETTNDA